MAHPNAPSCIELVGTPPVERCADWPDARVLPVALEVHAVDGSRRVHVVPVQCAVGHDVSVPRYGTFNRDDIASRFPMEGPGGLREMLWATCSGRPVRGPLIDMRTLRRVERDGHLEVRGPLR